MVDCRQAAVRQALDGGRSVPQVAGSLEMSAKTLANWVVPRSSAGSRWQSAHGAAGG